MKLVVTLLIGLSLSSCATLAPPQERAVTYQFKPSMSKGKIHARINEWVAKHFNDANTVIKMNDKEEGKLVVKGQVSCPEIDQFSAAMGVIHSLDFTLVATSTDNQANIAIEDIRDLFPPYQGKPAMLGQKPSSRAETDKLVAACMGNIAPEIEAALK
jgi:hypothetical protein